MTETDLLAARLAAAGFAGIVSLEPAYGGVVALAGLATCEDGTRLFAKTLADPGADLFAVEAEGLRALAEVPEVHTPAVRLAAADLLVLEPLQARPDTTGFWETLGHMVAALHTTTGSERFGWHRDGWLGRLRQSNAWSDDGHAFFAEHRLLRWLTEPLVSAAFDADDRRALEHLCERLPDLVPDQPAALTHGDLWTGNVLADAAGRPMLIDPAVSYTWPEVDLSMMWSCDRPAESDAFFAAYEEVARPHDGWRDRMPLLHLRELLSQIAHGDGEWGALDVIRKTIAPFRRVGV
jgi:fructosamine-3-kinase